MVPVLEELHGVQADDQRSLVVQDAAAYQESFAALHGPRVGGPAYAGGNNVRMANHGQRGLGFSREVGNANLAMVVVGAEAQALSKVHGCTQGVVRRGAGRVLRGGVGEIRHAGNGYQLADLADDVFPVFLDVGIGFSQKMCVGHKCSFGLV